MFDNRHYGFILKLSPVLSRRFIFFTKYVLARYQADTFYHPALH